MTVFSMSKNDLLFTLTKKEGKAGVNQLENKDNAKKRFISNRKVMRQRGGMISVDDVLVLPCNAVKVVLAAEAGSKK